MYWCRVHTLNGFRGQSRLETEVGDGGGGNQALGVKGGVDAPHSLLDIHNLLMEEAIQDGRKC